MQTSVIVYGLEHGFKQLRLFENLIHETGLGFYASDLFWEFGFTSFLDFQEALEKASEILKIAHIPVEDHIRAIFRDQNHQIFPDWKLSSLACHLIKINGAITNRNVAEYQIKVHSVVNDDLS